MGHLLRMRQRLNQHLSLSLSLSLSQPMRPAQGKSVKPLLVSIEVLLTPIVSSARRGISGGHATKMLSVRVATASSRGPQAMWQEGGKERQKDGRNSWELTI